MTITNDDIGKYRLFLQEEEKAAATVEKYVRDVAHFARWLGEQALTREAVLNYKAILAASRAATGVNAALSSLSAFFSFLNRPDLRIKKIKIQRSLYAKEERELSKEEYHRLLKAAERRSRRLFLLMQTLCAAGLRVSELSAVTVESLADGRAMVNNKGKRRTVFLPYRLCTALKKYCRQINRTTGAVFVTRNGKPLDRSNIWREMKRLAHLATVAGSKVFPHNLRHLFARTFYEQQKDIVRLADLLGHASINTTRIYTLESGATHWEKIQHLGLLRC